MRTPPPQPAGAPTGSRLLALDLGLRSRGARGLDLLGCRAGRAPPGR